MPDAPYCFRLVPRFFQVFALVRQDLRSPGRCRHRGRSFATISESGTQRLRPATKSSTPRSWSMSRRHARLTPVALASSLMVYSGRGGMRGGDERPLIVVPRSGTPRSAASVPGSVEQRRRRSVCLVHAGAQCDRGATLGVRGKCLKTGGSRIVRSCACTLSLRTLSVHRTRVVLHIRQAGAIMRGHHSVPLLRLVPRLGASRLAHLREVGAGRRRVDEELRVRNAMTSTPGTRPSADAEEARPLRRCRAPERRDRARRSRAPPCRACRSRRRASPPDLVGGEGTGAPCSSTAGKSASTTHAAPWPSGSSTRARA